jgi:hypothetical protein
MIEATGLSINSGSGTAELSASPRELLAEELRFSAKIHGAFESSCEPCGAQLICGSGARAALELG